MTSLRRIFFSCGIIGTVIPLIWLVISHLKPAAAEWLMLRGGEWVLLTLWPGALVMLAMPEEINVGIVLAAVFSNTVLYAIAGAIIWIGIKRSILVLLVAISMLLVLWSFLLKLYYGG